LALDTKEVLDAITPKTRAVFLTHVLGFNGLTDELIDGLKGKGIPLIEDVCESHGAVHKDKKVGTFGWASNFSFYYAHHMTTIEGGMVSTDDEDLYDMIRIMRSHGMVRESLNEETKSEYKVRYPDLNPDFIFAYPSHNMRSTELNAILGLEQLKRLDENNSARTRNLKLFISVLDSKMFQTNFEIDGSSNYAFTLVLRKPDFDMRNKVEKTLTDSGIEFRRGLSGGGNQLRQPYLRNMQGLPKPETLKVADHIHHFAWYIGNYPDLQESRIFELGKILTNLK
jgi:CDP-6-deoxy-D-xylo-4-hexulose-3-dehydrase